MKKLDNNYAFIDSQNLNLSILRIGWQLDFARFRIYLKEKYSVSKAFLFLGHIQANAGLYRRLEEDGYILIYKKVLSYKDGTVKGNVDAELILQSILEYHNYNKAVVVTGDGDFKCLVEYLISRNNLECLIVPDKFSFSALFKADEFKTYLRYMNDLEQKLSLYKEKAL